MAASAFLCDEMNLCRAVSHRCFASSALRGGLHSPITFGMRVCSVPDGWRSTCPVIARKYFLSPDSSSHHALLMYALLFAAFPRTAAASPHVSLSPLASA